MTERRLLPNRRACVTCGIRFREVECTLTVGLYPDGSIGEIFLTGGKIGADFEAAARDAAIVISLASQYGVPLEVMAGALTKNADGSPGSPIGVAVARLIEMSHDLGVKP